MLMRQQPARLCRGRPTPAPHDKWDSELMCDPEQLGQWSLKLDVWVCEAR